MYADDTAVVVSDRKLAEAEIRLQNCFNQLLRWSHDNGLVINASKTKVLHIRSPQLSTRQIQLLAHGYDCLHADIPVNCDCTHYVQQVDSCRYLGVTVDCRMKWDVHIDSLNKRLRACAYNIYALRDCLDRGVLRSVYCALVESHIRYGLESWGNTSRYYLEQIERTQKRTLRSIVGKKIADEDGKAYFRALDVLPVSGMFQYNIVLKYGRADRYRQVVHHDYSTRKTWYVCYRNCNDYGRQLLEHTVPGLLNKLPSCVQQADSVSEVKKLTKQWLLN